MTIVPRRSARSSAENLRSKVSSDSIWAFSCIRTPSEDFIELKLRQWLIQSVPCSSERMPKTEPSIGLGCAVLALRSSLRKNCWELKAPSCPWPSGFGQRPAPAWLTHRNVGNSYHPELHPPRVDCLAGTEGFELLNPETRGKRWGVWRLIFIAERSGLLRRLECHCRRAEIRADWPHPGSCPAGDGATAGLRW
jgi:hypothetical protein